MRPQPPHSEPTHPDERQRTRLDWLGLTACVAAAVVVLGLSWFKLSSLDIGYHLAYGRHFLDPGNIVERDPFLYPETAVPFINANWGSQVIMAMVERAAGPHGLFALRLLLIALVFTSIAVVARRIYLRAAPINPQFTIHNPQYPWLSWAWLLAALAGYERFSMRPELFSYAVMSIMLWLLVRGPRSWRTIVVLGLLQLLWVNLHSYFLVGLLLTAAFLAGEAGAWLLARRQPRRGVPPDQTSRGRSPLTKQHFVKDRAARSPEHDPAESSYDAARAPDLVGTSSARGSGRSGMRLLALALAVQVIVCFVNPWHYHGATFPLKTLQFLRGSEVLGGAAGDPAKSAWAEISEFQSPFSFHGQIGSARTLHAYYVLLAVSALGVLALLRRGQIGPALAVLVLFAMSTQMRRNIAQFSFVAAPLSFGALAAAIPWAVFDRTLRRAARPLLLLATVALSAWWAYDITSGRFYYVERRITREFGTGYSDRTFPRAAVQWLSEHAGLKPNLYIDYFSSSNTLPWLPDRFKLFVDTNTFAYADETLDTAFRLGLGEKDHRPFFERYGVNVVMLHSGPDTQMLIRRMLADDGDWALAWFDRHSVIFVRRIPEHLDMIPSPPLSAASLPADEWLAGLTGPAYARALTLGTIVNVPMSLGWSEPAAALMEEAVRLVPDYFEAWNYLGVCHGNLGNAAARARQYVDAERHWQAAIQCWDRVLSLSPGHEEASKYIEATRQRLALLRQPN